MALTLVSPSSPRWIDLVSHAPGIVKPSPFRTYVAAFYFCTSANSMRSFM